MATAPCTGVRRGPARDLYGYPWCTTTAVKATPLSLSLPFPPFFVQPLFRFVLPAFVSCILIFALSLFYGPCLFFFLSALVCSKPCIFILLPPLPHPPLPSILPSLLAVNDDIIDLPNEVLNSPMGGMLRPMLEQMTTQVSESLGETSFWTDFWAYRFGSLNRWWEHPGTVRKLALLFFFFFSRRFIFQLPGRAVVTGVFPFTPVVFAFFYIAQRAQHSHCTARRFPSSFSISRPQASASRKGPYPIFLFFLEPAGILTPGPHTL